MIVMKLLICFLLFSSSNSLNIIKWNSEEIETTVKPIVRKFATTWERHVILTRLFHYKTHFGIIIKKGTEFKLSVECSETIENLFFYCLSESSYRTINMLDFYGETNSTKIVTANSDCVPMTSVSYNIPVNIKITTKNWVTLPIFDSQDVTTVTSEEAESEFFRKVQVYGFVENYHTQMLLSLNDITKIKSAGYSLYKGLQNQVDVIKYYNYLAGASRYTNENDSFSYSLVEQATIFIRTEPCQGNCNYQAYFSNNWIACPEGVLDFLDPIQGSSWVLLHEIAHHYDINSIVAGFGDTIDVWTNIFASFYQHKFYIENYWMKETEFEVYKTVWNYQNGIPFKEWGFKEKLHLFMSLFGYDGTDKAFREFNIRYYSDPAAGKLKNNIIPTLLEVFLDLYDINLLPFLSKVLSLKEYSIPLLSPELELRLLGGHPVMPALDFKIKSSDLQSKSKERDFRDVSPLMLLSKIPKMYVNVKFIITSPIDLTDHCLYLNNNCHAIVGHEMELKLQVDVYSVYIVEDMGNLFVSEVEYHTIAEDTQVTVKVMEEYESSLPLVHYTFDARGFNDEIFLRMFINYKDMTIAVGQITDQIHYFFGDQLYCWIILERNGVAVFEYEFFGIPQFESKLINVVHQFEVNDRLYIIHQEPNRLQIDLEGFSNELIYNSFIFTNVGLQKEDASDFQITLLDIKRIDNYTKDYYIDLSYNELYTVYLDHYTNKLLSNGLENYIPKEWMLNLNRKF